jgi:hypothetical protein
VEESDDGVTFDGGLMEATVWLVPVPELGQLPPSLINSVVTLALRDSCDDIQTTFEDTVVMESGEWAQIEVVCTKQGIPRTITTFSTVHQNRLYMIIGLVPFAEFFPGSEELFQAMVDSFRWR